MKDDVIDMPIPTRLTFGGQLEGVSCGLADFLAQEEMDRCLIALTSQSRTSTSCILDCD